MIMPGQNEEIETEEEDFETEAKALGWMPEESFRGDKSKFIPAKEFVEKGRHVVPILQENNKRLQRDLLTRDQKIGKLSQDLKDLNEAFDGIEKRLSKVDKLAFERAKAQLKEELKSAREDGNIDAELDIQDKMDQLRKSADEAPKPDKKKPDPAPVELDPVLVDWMKENTWFGDHSTPENKKKSKEFLRIQEDLRDDGFSGTMREMITAVEAEYVKRNPPSRGESKVAGGGRASNGSTATTGKGWASLPKEAKVACMEFADQVVGPGKRYKTVEDWQKKYANDYHEGEAQ